MNVESFIKGFASGIEKAAMSPEKMRNVQKVLARRAGALSSGAKPRPMGTRGITEARQNEAVRSRISERLASGRTPDRSSLGPVTEPRTEIP